MLQIERYYNLFIKKNNDNAFDLKAYYCAGLFNAVKYIYLTNKRIMSVYSML